MDACSDQSFLQGLTLVKAWMKSQARISGQEWSGRGNNMPQVLKEEQQEGQQLEQEVLRHTR